MKRKKYSEFRHTKRLLMRRGDSRDKVQFYVDNKGIEYDYKWVAKLSSFYNIIMGCFKNGFPISVSWLWYNAWAFYPFFFVKRNLQLKDPIPILNHERIHVRQQRDIHVLISIPLLIFSFFAEWFGWFNNLYLLCSVPFIPTFIYGIEMIRSYRNLALRKAIGELDHITFTKVRENTCFEREAIMRGPNADYLFDRKFMAVLAYTGWKQFENYGFK